MTEEWQAGRVVERIRDDLGQDPRRWIAPAGYDSVALAVLDSIYSTGNHYTGVVNAVKKYRAARVAEGAGDHVDTASDLADAVERWGGPEALAERTNRWRTSPRTTSPYKAEAAYRAALVLVEHDLNTVGDIRAKLSDPVAQDASPAKAQWEALPGQRSGLTWTYFLMLCGVPGVKADRMVIAYVSRAVGKDVTSRQAAALVGAAAGKLGIDIVRLDHAIWRLESGRQVEHAGV